MEVLQADHSIEVTTMEYGKDSENDEHEMEDIDLSSTESVEPGKTNGTEINDETQKTTDPPSADCNLKANNDNSNLEKESQKENLQENSKNGSFFKTNKSSETYVRNMDNGNSLSRGDVVGSRLASPDVTASSHSSKDPNRSPIYNPKKPTSGVAMDAQSLKSICTSTHPRFGNTPTTLSPTTKLSNITLQDVQQVASNKADLVKSWSVRTFKCTKQALSEKLGRGTKTVDLALESKIETLRDTKRNYENLLRLSTLFAKHFTLILDTQKALGASFGELSVKSQELQDEFRYNAETHAAVVRNGEALLKAIDSFIANVTTLCSKTMEDSLLTISRYDTARLTYDAYKNELSSLNLRPRTTSNINKQAIVQAKFEASKAAYERLRDDVDVKLQFLDENRIKVMQHQLLFFNSAVSAFFSGNQEELEKSIKRCNSFTISASSDYSQ